MSKDLIEAELSRTKNLVEGRHILAIQDTTELNFQAHADKKTALKLNVNFWDYLFDRISLKNTVPKLPDLMIQAAQPIPNTG